MTRVLITGSAGALGSHLVRTFAHSGYDVCGLDRTQPRDKIAQQWILSDVRTADWPNIISEMDIVVHAAGFVHRATRTLNDELECFEINEKATLELGRACQARGASLHFVSSIAVYGPLPECRSIREDDTCSPVTVYGRSKLAAEQGLLSLRSRGLDVRIIRFPLLYGPGGHGNMERMLGAVKRRQYWPIRSDVKKSCVYIEDAADAVLRIATRAQVANSIYLVAPRAPVTIDEIHKAIYRAVGHWCPPPFPRRVAEMVGESVDFAGSLAGRHLGLRDAVDSLLQPSWCSGDRYRAEFGDWRETELTEGLRRTAEFV